MKIKQKLLFLLLGVLLPMLAQAQELTVKSMEMAPMDISASQYSRNDKNGNACALVKVQLAAAGAEFAGNVLGDCAYKTGEYWVYMSQGSYQLKIRHPNFVPLTVNFRDYGIRSVESKATYVLTLLMPQTGQAVDDGMRYLVMTVEPKTATVMVDDELRTLANGQLKLSLQKGSHSYSVMAEGYEPQRGMVTLNEGTERLNITLKSVMAELLVQCATAGAEVYLDGESKGKAPWRGSLPAGRNYEVELRLVGYHNNKQNITLQKSEQRTLNVPALQALTGNLNVDYDPLDAEVWLDGKKLGLSPETFRDILIGRHEVELRMSGYQSKKETIEIKDGQTALLTGNLVRSSSGQVASAANRSTVSSGSATTGTDNGHEWVDLGLSVCWATMNVGASSPGDYGDYYAWGETSTKSVYSMNKYWNAADYKWTKYCSDYRYGTVDNRKELDSDDDVAHVKWGGNWRMPTIEELRELKEKCKWKWSKIDEGYKVTGPNGNSIFLPAAGHLGSSLDEAGSYARYWSRTLSEIFQGNACNLRFRSKGVETGSSKRDFGFSVRPVRVSE